MGTIVSGLIISTICVTFAGRVLPLKKVTGFSYLGFLLFCLYLFGQIYISGFQVIKLIVLGARVDVVRTQTKLTNEFLRAMLGASVTLIPGSVLMDSKNEQFAFIWLRGKNAPPLAELRDPGDMVKGKPEQKLLKVQK